MVEPGPAVAPADDAAALVLAPHLNRADVPPLVTTAFLDEVNLWLGDHRRVVHAAAALVAAIDAHPGDAPIPRGALAPALDRVRRLVFRNPDAPPSAP